MKKAFILRDNWERKVITRALVEASGSQTQAAKALGVNRTMIIQAIKRLGIKNIAKPRSS